MIQSPSPAPPSPRPRSPRLCDWGCNGSVCRGQLSISQLSDNRLPGRGRTRSPLTPRRGAWPGAPPTPTQAAVFLPLCSRYKYHIYSDKQEGKPSDTTFLGHGGSPGPGWMPQRCGGASGRCCDLRNFNYGIFHILRGEMQRDWEECRGGGGEGVALIC